MTEETCDFCQEKGRLGMAIRAYSFAAPSGKGVIRFLHASDGDRDCYRRFNDRYRNWMAEQKGKASA
jgi:hypothetical protein